MEVALLLTYYIFQDSIWWAWVLAWGQGGVVLVKGVTGMQVADGGAGPPFTTSHFVKRTPNRYKGG